MISLALQKSFVAMAGIEHVAPFSSGHSPFLSMPEKLAEVLVALVQKFGRSRASEAMLYYAPLRDVTLLVILFHGAWVLSETLHGLQLN